MIASVAASLAFGCAQIIGATGDRELRGEGSETGSDAAADAEAGSPPDAGDPDACPSGQKKCNGTCVSRNDPAYGCAQAECTPCSLPNVDQRKCSADGFCEVGSCKTGWKDCGSSLAGCLSDLSAPNTCGDCKNVCQLSQVCNPGGCGADCDPGLTRCEGDAGTSCVDTTSSTNHCGACFTPCPGTANGDAVCTGSKCDVTCRAGYGKCDVLNPTKCVALTVFYRDLDGDGVGAVTQPVLACSAAQAGGGVAPIAGDCHPANGKVFPGQQAYLDAPYELPDGSKQLTFDYDCNGIEKEEPGSRLFTGCSVDCVGEGYLPSNVVRSIPNANIYCGSTKYTRCRGPATPINPSGSRITPMAEQCPQEVVAVPALRCR